MGLTIPRARRPGLRLTGRLQVLLTGKPCRNFQVLVAYSMLQMVREQVLQESMTSDGILLVRAPRAAPAPQPPSTPPRPLAPGGNCDALSTVLVLIETSSCKPVTSRKQRDRNHHSSTPS